MSDVKRWSGETPKECDLCHVPLTGSTFVDGRTAFGPWAVMCTTCHRDQRIGLGTGKGQQYDKNGICIAGSSLHVKTPEQEEEERDRSIGEPGCW